MTSAHTGRTGVPDLGWLPLSATLLLVATVGCTRPAQPPPDPELAGAQFSHGFEGLPFAHQRLELKKALVREKLAEAVLPALRAQNVDMWIVIDRENNADPLHDLLGWGYSGAVAVSLFFDGGSGDVEKVYIGSPQPADGPISQAYDVTEYSAGTPGAVAEALRKAVEARRPRRIAVNRSTRFPRADGLTAGLEAFLMDALGPIYGLRLVSAEAVVHHFSATHTPLETAWYTRLQEWTAAWEENALTTFVSPGRTTVLDLVCWLEDQATASGLPLAANHGRYPLIVWFGDRATMPGLANFKVDRPLQTPVGTEADARDFPIEPGDLITLDGGLEWLGFASDMKRTAYMLRPGENEAPQFLTDAWRDTLTVAERFARRLTPGATPEQVWTALAADVRALGFDMTGAPERLSEDEAAVTVTVYGHSTGNVVHDIGARIAQPQNDERLLTNSMPLVNGEWISVEFHLAAHVPGHNHRWLTRFEQAAQVQPGGARWLVSPQSHLLVARQNRNR